MKHDYEGDVIPTIELDEIISRYHDEKRAESSRLMGSVVAVQNIALTVGLMAVAVALLLGCIKC